MCTKVLLNYNPDDEVLREYKLAISYALQRIEAYTAERLYENRGPTKGTEFLLQNTLGYANKSDVNSKQELEVTEKQRISSIIILFMKIIIEEFVEKSWNFGGQKGLNMLRYKL